MNTNTVKILLVDDEMEVLNALKRLFRAEKYDVHIASSGKQALNILSETHVDVIISDVRMPGMNGVEFLSNVYAKWPETKRIVLTGDANIDDTLKMINECDIYRYFNKPWPKEKLKQAVDQAAEKKYLIEENHRLLALTKAQNEELSVLNQQLDEKFKESVKRLDKTKEQLHDELINEKKLRQARIGADKANEAKSRFLATMSHEIRSPLNSILVMNSLLLESQLTQEQREHTELAHQAGQMLLSLVNNILDFSKIESDQIELSHQWFNLADLIKNTHAILTSQAKVKSINLIYAVDDNVYGEFKGDEIRLKQIILNILTNAIKFTEQGHVSLKVYREITSENLVIEIEDSGIGIEPNQQKNVFNEFVQVEDDSNRRFSGTGLGLSIVKRLVSLMKGVISLSSQLGHGAKFTLALPLQFRETEQLQPSNNTVNFTTRESNLARFQQYIGTSILIVEDSQTNVAVIKALLSIYQFDLHFAYNGQDAINKAKETAYSLILMDLSMPVMDGIEATQWMRNNKNINQKTTIIAMTANAFTEDKIRCFQAGMNDYLSKPIDMSKFFNCLSKHLNEIPITNESPIKPAVHNIAANDVIFNVNVAEVLIRDVGVEIFPKILSIYQEETEHRIDYMQQLLAQNNWHDLNNEAHALKSSSGSFGFTKMQNIAKAIEYAKLPEQQNMAANNIRNLNVLYKESIASFMSYFETIKA